MREPDDHEFDPDYWKPDPEDLLEFDKILERSTELKAEKGSPGYAPSETVDERLKEVQLRDDSQTVTLKGWLAGGSFVVVALQLAAANVAFFVYGFANDWHIDTKVMMAWMAATVVETVGIVYVIARSLFPDRHPG